MSPILLKPPIVPCPLTCRIKCSSPGLCRSELHIWPHPYSTPAPITRCSLNKPSRLQPNGLCPCRPLFSRHKSCIRTSLPSGPSLNSVRACSVSQSCPTLCDTMACVVCPLSMGFSRQEYWSTWPGPLLQDLLTQGLNLGLLSLLVDSLPLQLFPKSFPNLLGKMAPFPPSLS